MSKISRTLAASLALVAGLAFTAPAFASGHQAGNDLKICIKILGIKKCIHIRNR